MKTFVLVICLLPLALAHGGWSGEAEEKDDKRAELMEFRERLMRVKEMEKKKAFFDEFMTWAGAKLRSKGIDLPELTEEERKEKFHYFLEFKEKFMKMQEFQKKKAFFEEFMEAKGYNKDSMGGERKYAPDAEEPEGDFGEIMKKLKEGGKKAGIMITHAFLGLCKHMKQMEQGGMAADLKAIFPEDEAKDAKMDRGMKLGAEMEKLPENDDPALAAFLKKLSPEEQKMMFGHSLVNTMCESARTFIKQARVFSESYMQ